MDQHSSGNISDESDSFDKLDLSEIPESNEMDMKIVVEKITKLEADILAIKTKQQQNENAGQMLQMICQIKEMKKEMVVMNSELNGEFVGFEDEVGKLVEENGKLKEENKEKGRMEEMKKEMDGMNKQMNKLKEGIDKILKKMETINNENLMEKFEMKKKFEQGMKTVIDIKDRGYDELKEICEKLKKELAEKECATKEMEKNKTEIGVHNLLRQLDPKSKQRMRMVFESLRLASGESIEIIDPIIEFGFINSLVKALNAQDEKIRLNAAWALTNIAAGNSAHTRAIVEANGIEPLLKMCTSVNNLWAEQALWAIANIAADNIKYRDELIARGVVPLLLEKAKRMDYLKCSFVRTIAWSIESLCCHEPLPSYDLLVQLVPTIAVLLKYKDIQCKIDTCWTVVHLTSGPKKNIPLALDFIQNMVSFIKSGGAKLILPALRVLENFTKIEPNIFDDARIKQCGFSILLSLKYHKSNEIGKIADSILNKFFPKCGKMKMK